MSPTGVTMSPTEVMIIGDNVTNRGDDVTDRSDHNFSLLLLVLPELFVVSP